jgi:two-component system, NtrC family, nitrogen regulation sensor histidine kinase NtrY
MNRFALGILLRLAGLLWLGINLYSYTTGINRKLTHFLESVRYSDFTNRSIDYLF